MKETTMARINKREMFEKVAILAQAREVARAEHERALVLEDAFVKVFDTATGMPTDALKGKIGTRVYIQDPTDGGELVLEVISVGQTKAVKIIATFMSRFDPCDWYLPLWMILGDTSFPGYFGRFEFQQELRTLLRRVWTDDIATLETPKMQRQLVRAPQLGVKGPKEVVMATREAPKVAKPKARLLTWRRIEGGVGYFTNGDLFFDCLSVGSAWIHQRVEAGARKFVLVDVSKDHPLKGVWERVDKEEVQVDIAQVFPKGLVTATNFEDTPMLAARREFARYLKERHDELKTLDVTSAVSVPVSQSEYDPFEVRGIYEQQFGSS